MKKRKDMNLPCVLKSVKEAGSLILKVFFSTKTPMAFAHFRAIVSERKAWPGHLGRHLQKGLGHLEIDDHFLIWNSEPVVTLLRSSYVEFSGAVKHVYYLLPRHAFFRAVRECIEEAGQVKFDYEIVISGDSFLEFLSFYLKVTLINFHGDPY